MRQVSWRARKSKQNQNNKINRQKQVSKRTKSFLGERNHQEVNGWADTNGTALGGDFSDREAAMGEAADELWGR